jgi:hypothetical protein
MVIIIKQIILQQLLALLTNHTYTMNITTTTTATATIVKIVTFKKQSDWLIKFLLQLEKIVSMVTTLIVLQEEILQVKEVYRIVSN